MTAYKLSDFTAIKENGFNYTVPEEVIKIIYSLSIQVGSPTYIKTPVFQKKTNSATTDNSYTNKKRNKGYKYTEVGNDDWEIIRNFQATKMEKKTGIDNQINQLRLLLNKLTDKTFIDIHAQIINIIEKLIEDKIEEDDMNAIGLSIFEIASTNKFYSRMYADLYADLIHRYEFLRPIFQKNYDEFITIFNNIETADPSVDYNKFCEINKINEKRKAVSTFFVNLMTNNVVSKNSIVNILHRLLEMVVRMINEENKIDEVHELTENIIILFKKDLIESVTSESDEYMINGESMNLLVERFAKSKAKNHKSLSSKSIFKYMDLIGM